MEKLSYKIAIPSYKRTETLRTKTLNYLLNVAKIDPDKIYIFVANEEELRQYKEKIKEIKYFIVIGKPGIKTARNFMQCYFEENEYVVFFDDDIESLEIKTGEQTSKPLSALENLLIQPGLNQLLKNKTKIWGVYLPLNPYFMKHTVTKKLCYIPAGCMGMLIDKSKEMLVELDDKEDFERSIKFYDKYGSVIRFNGIAMKTKCYTEAGGMQVERTQERIMQSCIYLAKKYPQYCKLLTTKKHPEVKLCDYLKLRQK